MATVTSERLKGIKISLVGEGGRSAFWVYGVAQEAIMKAIHDLPNIGEQPAAQKAAPKRRGRRPKAASAQPEAAAA